MRWIEIIARYRPLYPVANASQSSGAAMFKIELSGRTCVILVGVLIVGLFDLAAAQLQAPIACKGPLSEAQLSRLVTSGVADARIQEFLQQCGVDFESTEAIDERLKRAGASEALMRFVHQHSPKTGLEQRLGIDATPEHELGPLTWPEYHRLPELRKKLGLDVAPLQDLAPTTLDEALKRLRSLKAQKGKVEARLKAEYPDLGTSPHPTKETFETTAEYEARLSKAAEERKAVEASYRRIFQALTANHDAQIAELLSRQYDRPGLKVALKSYDADHGRLLAAVRTSVSECSYIFLVQPTKARVLYAHEGVLRVKGSLPEVEEKHRACATEATLFDSQTNEGARSVGPFPFGFAFAASRLVLNGRARIVGDRLRLTDVGRVDEAASAFLDHRVKVQAFTVQFGFQLKEASADGFTVVFQNMGPSALGPLGGGLGYGHDKYSGSFGMAVIQPSVAVKFQFIPGREPTTGLLKNGESPGDSNISFKPSSVNICNGDVYRGQIDYDGKKLSLTVTDRTNPSSRFSTDWEVDIPATVGSATAFVGFTAGTGGLTSTQEITDWIYEPFD